MRIRGEDLQMSRTGSSQKAMAPKQAPEPMVVRTILRMAEVKRASGLEASHIYALIRQGKFPRPIKLSSQAVGWLSDEIAEWQASRPRAEGGWSPRRREDAA
jgi:prophage regulatory protein